MTIPAPNPEDVDVNINISVQSRQVLEEVFHPTDVNIETFQAKTNLDEYLSVTPTICGVVWAWLEEQRALQRENFLQFEIRLDNATAVAMGAGAYPLPKGHRSAGMTGSAATSQEVIERAINEIVADLRQRARY